MGFQRTFFLHKTPGPVLSESMRDGGFLPLLAICGRDVCYLHAMYMWSVEVPLMETWLYLL